MDDAQPRPDAGDGRRRPDATQRAEALKERIYVTFTSLAVVIAVERSGTHASVAAAATTLVLTVLGTLLAVLVSDLLAHMVREEALPDRAEIRHLLWVSLGSLSVVVLPLVLLGAAAIGILGLDVALRTISVVLVLTLVLVTLLAVRRLRVRLGVKVGALVGIALLGVAVLVVELAVH